MQNLVIGNTAQLAYYFPKDYIKISSRNIDHFYLKNNTWGSVYICFSEQRIRDTGSVDFISVNYFKTFDIIQSILNNSQRIVTFGTCKLWNNLSGYITIDTPPKFFPLNNEYTISKLLLLNKILELRELDDRYKKVIFIHPFYFNSIHRSKYFLFGHIFDSIINKKKIEVGNINFYRDMVHAKFVVEKSIEATKDIMVGAGRLFNVRDFIKDLYEINGLDFESLVKENKPGAPVGREKLIMAKVPWNYTYKRLLEDTQNELEKKVVEGIKWNTP